MNTDRSFQTSGMSAYRIWSEKGQVISVRSKESSHKLIWILFLCMLLCLSGCSNEKHASEQKQKMEQWLIEANFSDTLTKEELYEAALLEDTLVIYSVSSRVFEVKESFEQEYPGLTVEIKDVRGEDIVNMLQDNYQKQNYACDLVICSDCNGRLNRDLLEPGILYSYIPTDIAPMMKEGHADHELVFVGEALMFFYNENAFAKQPIYNIWELTEEKYKGKIIMANPLSSFSTYGFCSAVLGEPERMAEAYEEYAGKALDVPEGKTAGEVFWEQAASNIVFTNSSDEVLEGIGGMGSDDYWIGIMISSKMRYQDLGYHFAPIYRLNPFSTVYTPNSVTIAAGSPNVNTAKLFVRYLLGETDGTGAGIQPFMTTGTWSTRVDVEDANEVPLSKIDYLEINKEYLYENMDAMSEFWHELLKENVTQ